MDDLDDLDERQRMRIIDFLDDKLQTWDDLSSIDSLLADVGTQHDLLQQQVRLGDSR